MKLKIIDKANTKIEDGSFFLVNICREVVLRQVIRRHKRCYAIISPIEGREVALFEDYSGPHEAALAYSGCNGEIELVEVPELAIIKTGVKFHGGDQ